MRYLALIGAVLMSACTSVDVRRDLPVYSGEPESQQIAAGNTAFGADLYRELKQEDGNIFISPASISTAFGLAYAGARGDTATEIKQVLHFDVPEAAFHPAMANFLADLQLDKEDRILKINNATWFEQTSVVEQPYLDLIAENYRTEDNRVDFIGNPDASRQTINEWVESKTNDRIRNLLSPRDIKRDTRYVLVNTIYFDADWQRQFSAELTRDEAFSLSRGEEVPVPMMNQTSTFRHWQNRQLQVVELPYRGNEISMVALLPKKVEGLADLEETMVEGGLENVLFELAASDLAKVELKLPRLKIEQRYDLGTLLEEKLGMVRSFSDFADFTGMVVPDKQPSGLGVKIGKVIHQTFLEVDEKGTEAAAATAIVGVEVTSARIGPPPPPPIPFHADHPFMLLLKHNETGALLFMGRVVDPRVE